MEYTNLLALRLVAETNEVYIKATTGYSAKDLDDSIALADKETEHRIETLNKYILECEANINDDTYKSLLKEHKESLESIYTTLDEDLENSVELASFISEENLKAINETSILQIELDTCSRVTVKIIGVLSKANYKALANISLNLRINRNEAIVNLIYIKELVDIVRKSTKIKQEKLETILKCRLEGLYKSKHKNGKTWNQDGIDKA